MNNNYTISDLQYNNINGRNDTKHNYTRPS